MRANCAMALRKQDTRRRPRVRCLYSLSMEYMGAIHYVNIARHKHMEEVRRWENVGVSDWIRNAQLLGVAITPQDQVLCV